MALLFCSQHNKEIEHVRIYTAHQIASVSRPTVYHWLEKNWIHARRSPSGLLMVCRESLVNPQCNSPKSKGRPAKIMKAAA